MPKIQCTKCKKFKEESSEFFRKKKDKVNGLDSWCRVCNNIVCKKWIKNHKDSVAEYSKKWREEHREYGREYMRIRRMIKREMNTQ